MAMARQVADRQRCRSAERTPEPRASCRDLQRPAGKMRSMTSEPQRGNSLTGRTGVTPSLPSMRGAFTTPRRTSRAHTTTLVRGGVEGRVVGRRKAARSAVSGKSLARASAWPFWN